MTGVTKTDAELVALLSLEHPEKPHNVLAKLRGTYSFVVVDTVKRAHLRLSRPHGHRAPLPGALSSPPPPTQSLPNIPSASRLLALLPPIDPPPEGASHSGRFIEGVKSRE